MRWRLLSYCPPSPHPLQQVVRDYLPDEAPPELLGAAAAATAPQCGSAVPAHGLRLLEAALLLAFLGALAAWLYSLLSLPRPRQPHTPKTADDPDAPLVLADFPRFPHRKEDASWPTSSNSRCLCAVAWWRRRVCCAPTCSRRCDAHAIDGAMDALEDPSPAQALMSSDPQLCDQGGGVPALCRPGLLQAHWCGLLPTCRCVLGLPSTALAWLAPDRQQCCTGKTCCLVLAARSSHAAVDVARVHAAPSSHPSRAGFPDPASSPKAQLPYLQRGQQRIGDSHFIVQHLVRWEGQGRGRPCVAAVRNSLHLGSRAATSPLFPHVTATPPAEPAASGCSSGAAPATLLHPADPQARATAVAVARMCDTDLAAAIVYERWVDYEVRVCEAPGCSSWMSRNCTTTAFQPLMTRCRAGGGAGTRCWARTACRGRCGRWWRAWLARPASCARGSRQGRLLFASAGTAACAA